MSASRAVKDWSVYVITDSRYAGNRSLSEMVELALQGGARVVQYREKRATTRVMVEEASGLKALCDRYGACFLINDRLDVALAVDAHGVHLGQDDMPVPVARRLLGKDRIIGVTVHNAEEIERAQEEGADYLSIAPVFPTKTKPDHQTPLGIEGLRRLVPLVDRPVVAISGIHQGNVRRVIQAGVDGVCVVSAVFASENPEAAVRELKRLIHRAREDRP